MTSANVFQSGIFRVHQSGVPLNSSASAAKGKSDLPPVLIMLSGYPDTAHSWSRLSPHFASTHHVLCLAMPSYEDDTLPADRRWGHRLTDIVVGLTELIRSYKSRGCPIHLVGHDWGSFVVLLLVNQPSAQSLIDKLVVLDVGALNPLRLSLKQGAVMLLYQSFFAIVFVFSRLLPRENWAMPLLAMFPYRTIGPCPYETEMPFNPKDIKVHMLYPYLQLYVPYLRGPMSMTSVPYTKDVPQLFLYGGRKRVQFCTQDYFDELDKSTSSSYKEFKESGHWLHWTHSAEVAHEMKLFLRR